MEVPVSCLPPVKVILPLCLSSTRQLRATFTKASSFCLWYLGIVAHTRNTRHTLIVLAWYIVMARGRQCNNNWKVRSFFVFKETQEVHSCIVSLCVFFFFNEERSTVGVVLPSTDWPAHLWLAVRRLATLRSTSNLHRNLSKPRPSQTLATSALMMLASSIFQERPVNWTPRRNRELFLQPLLEITDESVFVLWTCLTASRFLPVGESEITNLGACAIKFYQWARELARVASRVR